MQLRQAVALAAFLVVVAVVTLTLPEVAVQAEPLFAAVLLRAAPAALVAETVLAVESAAALEVLFVLVVLAETLILAVLVRVAAAALVAETVLVVELEPVAADLILAVGVAVAPVPALVVVEYWC